MTSRKAVNKNGDQVDMMERLAPFVACAERNGATRVSTWSDRPPLQASGHGHLVRPNCREAVFHPSVDRPVAARFDH